MPTNTCKGCKMRFMSPEVETFCSSACKMGTPLPKRMRDAGFSWSRYPIERFCFRCKKVVGFMTNAEMAETIGFCSKCDKEVKERVLNI